MSPVLLLRFRRVWRWAVVLAALHAATVVLLWVGGVPPPVAAGLTVIVCAHAVHAVGGALVLFDASAIALELGTGGNCAVRFRAGAVITGTVADATLVSGPLVIVAVRSSENRRTCWVPVLPGMIDPEVLRALRVRLRWDRALRTADDRTR